MSTSRKSPWDDSKDRRLIKYIEVDKLPMIQVGRALGVNAATAKLRYERLKGTPK